ncbi:hypothetical protein PF002_g20199 [Phytophthora fragariae]|nr:hypothetical protein PF002_g20199 [Phytophthora fragariae]
MATDTIASYKMALDRERDAMNQEHERPNRAVNPESTEVRKHVIELLADDDIGVTFHPSPDRYPIVYPDSVIEAMTTFHEKRKLIRAVDYCIQWLTAEARLRQISESIENILAATRVTSVCTNVSITSNQVAFFYELLAFRGSEWINDMCIRLAVDVMTQNRPEVRYVDASQVLS